MENKNDKHSLQKEQAQHQQPGSMSSYNNRKDNREGQVEETESKKDESESYMDYNGNPEENAPAGNR